jgi:hypothetical protein
MADGYGAGLFDDSGPKNFASAIGGISSALTGVGTAFSTFGKTASDSLSGISTTVDALISKLGQVQSQLANITSGAGAQGGGAPPPQQSGIQPGSQWATGAGPSPNSQTGAGAPQAGMPQDTAANAPGFWSKTFGWLTNGTAAAEGAQYGGTQPGGGNGGASGMPQGTATTMGQRAVQSMIPAAIGAATGYAGGMMSTAVQGATIGQMYAPAFGVSSRSMYVMPNGILAQNPQDYAQSNYYAIQNLGIAPGTQNWSSIMGPGGGLNQLMTLDPGLTRQQAAQSYGNMMAPQTLNSAMSFGFNFSPQGKMQTPQQQYQQVFSRLAQGVGGKPTGAQVESWLRPGGPWSSNLASMGWQPGSAEYQGFVNYALTQVGMQGQGKSLIGSGINLGTTSGAQQTPLGNTPAYSQLQAQSAQSQVESQAEPALAQAAKDLNQAATQLLHAVDPLASLFGGGGPGGMLGSVVGMGGMYMGGKLLGKVGGKVLGGVGGKVLGKLGGKLGGLGDLFGGGSAADAEETVAKTAGKGMFGNLLKGGLGKLFQGGAADAGEQLGFEGMESTAGGGLKSILNRLIGGNLGEDAAQLGMKGGLGDLLKGGVGRLTGGGLGNLLKGGMGRMTGGGLGNLLKGGLGNLLKGGAGTAGAEAGEVGGLEAAGAGLDATGVGLPVGLLMGAAGLGLGFHKQIGHFIGGIGHDIGGLFGHHKKSTAAPDGTEAGAGDVASLLSAKPPTNSLLACLTSQVKTNDNTVISVLMNKTSAMPRIGGGGMGGGGGAGRIQTMDAFGPLGGGGGGGGVGGGGGGGAGGASGSATGSAPSQPYTWGYKSGGLGPSDMSSMFMTTSSSGGNSASSSSSSSSSSTGGPASALSGSGNVQQAYNYFLGKGLKDYMAAGIVGNMAQESGVNPTISQIGGGGGFGIVQWTPPTALQAWAKQNNRDVNSLSTQLDFLWYQMNSTEKGALVAVQASTDAASAAQAFEQQFERAGIPAMQNRINYAQKVLSSKGASYARGSQLIARNQLAMLHAGEAVVPAADNYSSSPYNKNGASNGGSTSVQLNFKAGSVVLQVPPSSSQQDMENLANQFVAAISKPQVLAGVRST